MNELPDAIWQAEHSVEASASCEFAWAYMSNVTNWDDPPAEFGLDGPFVDGSHGTTQMPGEPPRHWLLRDVVPMKSYTIEFALDGAVMYFEWRFTALDDGRTRLAQRVVLEGENTAACLSVVRETFGVSLKPGMEKIAASIEAAYISRR